MTAEWTIHLRKASEAPVPYKSRLVTLLRISPHTRTIEEANSKGGKIELISRAASSDIVLAAWPGEWSQDVFLVDDLTDARTALAAR